MTAASSQSAGLPDLLPTYPLLTGRCQRASNVGAHSLLERVRWRMRGGLGIRPALRRILGMDSTGTVDARPLGDPSAFRAGDWVRVRPEADIRQTLDGRNRTRGLEFGRQQWPTCGRVFQVTAVVQRIIDDNGRLRRVNRTVLLDDVHCDSVGDAVGCGRACPMMYRDEWLEPADAPKVPDIPGPPGQRTSQATVRPLGEIRKSLDPLGRRGNVLFMPEMANYCGMTLPVRQVITRVWEFEKWIEVPIELYTLEGVRCTGAVLGGDGPCHRLCQILWHRDWLIIEEAG